jgi:ABC-type Fe3+-hydroxamate transport system substrate-binding protein
VQTGVVSIVDERGKKLVWPTPPTRIVSAVPSDTYSLVRLGAGPRLVGRTRYCVEPEADVAEIEIVGGTKDLDVGRVIDLRPDCVIANREENTRRDIERLEEAGIAVSLSFPRNVAGGIAHLARLARLLGPDDGRAREVVRAAYHAHEQAETRRRSRRPVRVFFPIWMDPLMTVNGDTFISDLLDLVGGQNVFADRARRYPLAADLGQAPPLTGERVASRDTRYPRITLDEIVARQPEVILLPSEPHAFTERDADVFRELDVPAARAGRIVFCDGRDVMWPGARSLDGLERLERIIQAAASTT